MLLTPDAIDKIEENIIRISKGEKPPMIGICSFSNAQFRTINEQRAEKELHLLESNEILFIGRHLYQSRTRDGYSISDIMTQIISAMQPCAVPFTTQIATYIENPNKRSDGYGNMVNDRAVFEMTAKKPKAELLSVQPKHDFIKPPKS